MVYCVSAPAHRPFRVSFSHLFLLVLVLCAATVAPVAAQPPVVVAGLVTDLSGGVLPGATIEARRGLRVLAVATTGVDGRYRLELPPEGAERVAARLAGFAPAAVDLTVAAGAATLDFQLDLAPLQDTVVVTASRTAERRGVGDRVACRLHRRRDRAARQPLGGGRAAAGARLQRAVDRPGGLDSLGLRARRRSGLQPRADRRRARERRRRDLRLRPRGGRRDRAGRGGAGRAVGALRLGCDRLGHPDLHEAGGAGQRSPVVGLSRGGLVRHFARRPAAARRRPPADRLPARRRPPAPRTARSRTASRSRTVSTSR